MTATNGPSSGGSGTVAAEVGLLVLALGTMLSLCRLLADWDWTLPLTAVVVIAWSGNLVLRRVGCPMPIAALGQLVVGAVVITRVVAPETAIAFVVPTPASFSALAEAIDASFGAVGDLVAPVTPSDGFIAAIALGMWVIAAFADAAAIRYRAPVQAAVPYIAVFVALGVLAREHGRTEAALLFGGALACYVLAQRYSERCAQRWFGDSRPRGVRATAASGAALLAVAFVVAAVAAPMIPFDDDPVVDLREIGRGAGPRTVVSPFVGIRSLLTERSDEVMFRVESSEGAYWRLTALERFDADQDIWVSRVRYSDVGAQLPEVGPSPPSRPVAQRFEIVSLTGLWLPAAFRPDVVDSPVPLSYDADSASLILREGEPQPSMTYEVTSLVPTIDDLGDAPVSAGPAEHYLEVPELPPTAMEQLEQFRVLDDPAQQMVALQNWFRDFDYDEDVDFSGSVDPIADFLDQRRGFCQQFSSTFALFARSLGIPSRVAVGFTAGYEDQPGSFTVRGRNAHAWPEVYLADLGWVAFEPTPQRGNPQAEQYTGVPPAQAEAPAPTTTVAPETTEPPVDTTLPSPSTPPTTTAETRRPPAASSDDAGATRWPVIVVVAFAVGMAVAAVALRRRRGRSPGDSPRSREQLVRQGWQRALASVAKLGLVPERGETPLEFAGRCTESIDTDALGRLAEIETRRRFAPSGPTVADCEEVPGLLEHLGHDVASSGEQPGGERRGGVLSRR